MRATLALLLILGASAADACTTFCTRGLFGRNYDFETGTGMVMVNKRGLAKTSQRAQPASWTSRYGSVTFNQWGRDNATGGMNEKGLVVELMWLDGTRYPKADARPELGTLEWIQYQLDTAATVQEVVESAKKVRISERGVPLHYLVADASGDVAAVEFLGGELVVHRGDKLPVAVLANDPYAQSVAGQRGNSAARFTRAAKGLASATSVDAAFALLDEVAQQSTQWSIVYDLRNRAVTYRTAANREKRSLRFAELDFACATPVRVLDVDSGRGNVASLLRDYTRAANESLVRRSTKETSFTRDTPDDEIVEAARWPEKSACASTAQARAKPAQGTPSATTRRP
ncbi:MAG TPA: linear amide C-N hydrolase [Thermoanaerobaculia bacterium]|nr:linear amide C-N hydrolase [Thermoanaerobaculia bacterium]